MQIETSSDIYFLVRNQCTQT